MIFNFVQNTSEYSNVSKHCFFGSAITWLKVIQTLQIGGVLPFLSAPTVRFLSLKLIHPVFTLHVSVHISW